MKKSAVRFGISVSNPVLVLFFDFVRAGMMTAEICHYAISVEMSGLGKTGYGTRVLLWTIGCSLEHQWLLKATEGHKVCPGRGHLSESPEDTDSPVLVHLPNIFSLCINYLLFHSSNM